MKIRKFTNEKKAIEVTLFKLETNCLVYVITQTHRFGKKEVRVIQGVKKNV